MHVHRHRLPDADVLLLQSVLFGIGVEIVQHLRHARRAPHGDALPALHGTVMALKTLDCRFSRKLKSLDQYSDDIAASARMNFARYPFMKNNWTTIYGAGVVKI